ncbi:MAG: hypothetical protein IMW94_01545 [Thermoanaerobacter sp.]|nr:hypothetical protein [Thermoanaerobacter sp.]
MDDARFFALINEERQRQDEKYGKRHHPLVVWLTILTEEVGELAREILACSFPGAKCSLNALEKEAIQIAAVAKALWEQLQEPKKWI